MTLIHGFFETLILNSPDKKDKYIFNLTMMLQKLKEYDPTKDTREKRQYEKKD